MKKKYFIGELSGDKSVGRDGGEIQVIEAESFEEAVRIYNEKKKEEEKRNNMSNWYQPSRPEPLSTRPDWKEVEYEGD